MTPNAPLRIALRWIAPLAILALGGCSLFNRSSAAQAQFLLSVPPPAVVADRAPSANGIEVSRVTAVAPFDALGFVYAQADGSWRTDNYAGWIAAPSSMLTTAFVGFLSESKQFSCVTGQGAAVAAPCKVSLVLERFCGNYSNAASPHAEVQLRWYLVGDGATSAALLGSGVAVGTAPISAATPGAVADSLGAASAVAFGEILAQLSGNPAVRSK